MKKERIPTKNKPVTEKIKETGFVKWLNSSLGKIVLESMVIVVCLSVVLVVLISSYARNDIKAIPATIDDDTALLLAVESINQYSSSINELSENISKTVDEFSSAFDELRIMNSVFMEWAEGQGLITRISYEHKN